MQWALLELKFSFADVKSKIQSVITWTKKSENVHLHDFLHA